MASKPGDLVAAYLELSSAIISDALDAAGIPGTIEGVSSQVPGKKMCGPAFTARYTLATATNTRFADFLDAIPTDAVVAIDNSGRTAVSVWGDTLSLFAVRHRFAGTIIDGVCRDIDGTRALGYPMFSCGTFMRTGKGRIAVESTQEPIVLGTVVVRPGDLIFGDDTGAVAIPKERAEEVLALAHRIVARDRACVQAIESGAPIDQVWAAGAKA
ncbi:RraA family protein [Azospirillum doebereinerae]